MFKTAAKLLAPKSPLGYNLPSSEWFQYMKEETRYTPDIAVIEQFEWQWYFACDETQVGHLKHSLLGECEYGCPGFTQQSFNYWSPETPFVSPIPLEASGWKNPVPGWPEIAKIKGQLLKVRPQGLINLDEYRENGVQYLRKKVRIIVPYRALKRISDHPDLSTEDIEQEIAGLGLTFERVCVIRAWMYVGIPEYWDKLISTFDYKSVQTYQAKNRQWCKTYYQLRRPPIQK